MSSKAKPSKAKPKRSERTADKASQGKKPRESSTFGLPDGTKPKRMIIGNLTSFANPTSVPANGPGVPQASASGAISQVMEHLHDRERTWGAGLASAIGTAPGLRQLVTPHASASSLVIHAAGGRAWRSGRWACGAKASSIMVEVVEAWVAERAGGWGPPPATSREAGEIQRGERSAQQPWAHPRTAGARMIPAWVLRDCAWGGGDVGLAELTHARAGLDHVVGEVEVALASVGLLVIGVRSCTGCAANLDTMIAAEVRSAAAGWNREGAAAKRRIRAEGQAKRPIDKFGNVSEPDSVVDKVVDALGPRVDPGRVSKARRASPLDPWASDPSKPADPRQAAADERWGGEATEAKLRRGDSGE